MQQAKQPQSSESDFFQIQPQMRLQYELNMISVMIRYPKIIASIVDVLSKANFKHTLPSSGGGSVPLAALYGIIEDLWRTEYVDIITVSQRAMQTQSSCAGFALPLDVAQLTNNDAFTATNSSYHAFVLLQEDFYTAARNTFKHIKQTLQAWLASERITTIEAMAREENVKYVWQQMQQNSNVFESVDKAVGFFKASELEMEQAAFEKLQGQMNERSQMIAHRVKVQQMLERVQEVAALDSRSTVAMKILTKAMLQIIHPHKDHTPLLMQLENLKF